MDKLVYLITSNPKKLLAAKEVFDKNGICVKQMRSTIHEIQADNSMEIAHFAAVEMHKKTGFTVIREDHSLYLDGLNFPGPYTNYFNRSIPVLKFVKLLNALNIKSGRMEVSAVLAGKGIIKQFSFNVPLDFSLVPKGNLAKGWDKVMMLKGESRTFAEYSEDERLTVWQKNFEDISKFILSKK
ncbi:Non-canonical purine NTP pyrophosphatase [uncultured archaeon]|nr:Non-canonical purine NTP pyrophosphatase [uncultured archaeon]